MARPLITQALTEPELKKLRAKPFPVRNNIIQDKLAKHQKVRLEKIRSRKPKNFIF